MPYRTGVVQDGWLQEGVLQQDRCSAGQVDALQDRVHLTKSIVFEKLAIQKQKKMW